MKTKIAIFIGATLLTNVAMATTLVVKDVSPDSLTDKEWAESAGKMRGDYTKVKVREGFEVLAQNYFLNAGIKAEQSVSYRAPGDIVEQYRPYSVQQQDTEADSKWEFNDPLRSSQPALNSNLNGLYAGMLSQRDRFYDVNVMIMDSGSTEHDDIKFAPSLNYVSSDDSDPTNSGEPKFNESKNCEYGHGLRVASVIGAEQNNEVGVTGIADVNISVTRTFDTSCDTGEIFGELTDLYDAMLDASSGASSIPVPDVMVVNAKAEMPCPAYLQEAIDTLNSVGTTIVVEAGDNSYITPAFAPANCQNVIVVGSHEPGGEISPSTNQGSNIDLLAQGQHYVATKADEYGIVNGSIYAASAVGGMAAVLKQNFPSLTPAQMKSVLKSSALDFPSSTADYCSSGCGVGYANLDRALRYAEKVIDPTISFEHAMTPVSDAQACLTTREIEALSPHMDVCNSIVGTVNAHYAEGDYPVNYSVSLMRRPSGSTSWVSAIDERVETLSTLTPDANNAVIPILNVNADEFDYAIVACDSGITIDDTRTAEDMTKACPFVNALDVSNITYPEVCM